MISKSRQLTSNQSDVVVRGQAVRGAVRSIEVASDQLVLVGGQAVGQLPGVTCPKIISTCSLSKWQTRLTLVDASQDDNLASIVGNVDHGEGVRLSNTPFGESRRGEETGVQMNELGLRLIEG